MRLESGRILTPRGPSCTDNNPCLSILLFFAILWPTLSACVGESDSKALAGVRWDSAGVEIVEHRLVAANGAPVFEVDYLLRVSDLLESGVGEFGRVTDADLLPNGDLAVFDALSAEVRVFSSSGDFIRRIGRKGEGPGELSGGWTLGLLPVSEGRLALPDLVNQAIVVFDSTGSHLENIRWDVMEETIPQWRVLSGDTLLVIVTTEETNSFVKRPLHGDWRDTVAVQAVPVPDPSPTDGRGLLFTNHALWSASSSPDLLVLSQMAQPTLVLFEGDTLRRMIRWSPEDLELSELDVDVLFRVVARGMGDFSGDPETARRYFAPPEYAPALADVEIGPGLVLAQRLRPFDEMDGRILSTFGARGFGGPLWDAYSWSGDFLGTLDFGENVEVFRVRGDTVVGIQEDSLGVARPFLALLPRELVGDLRSSF
jgi:hypothetical protein